MDHDTETGSNSVLRAARIEYFCKHNILLNGKNTTHYLVYLSWFKYHPKHSSFGKPVSVWFHDLFEFDGIYSLIPIHFIKFRAASLIEKLDDQHESVLFVSPFIDF